MSGQTGPEKKEGAAAPAPAPTANTTTVTDRTESITPATPSLQGLSEREIHELIIRESEAKEAESLARAATFDEMGLRAFGDVERQDAEGFRNDAEAERTEIAWIDHWERSAQWWRENLEYNRMVFARLERETPERLARIDGGGLR